MVLMVVSGGVDGGQWYWLWSEVLVVVVSGVGGSQWC